LLFWALDFSSLAAPSHERLMELRAQLKESTRRAEGIQAEDVGLAKRLGGATAKINESRASLSALVGLNDSMVQELDSLIQACVEQRNAIPKLKQSAADASRAIAVAKRAMGPINKGIEALSVFTKVQVEWLKKGDGSLRLLKKQHDTLLKKGSRVAKGVGGKLGDVDAAIARANQMLSERERIVLDIQGVVSTAEIVLGTGS
jgi:chromosome segregation ATPase